MPVTELKPVTRPEFIALFESDVHDQINTLLDRPGVAGVVCFENLDISSPSLGHRAALIYGPGCETKSLTDLRERHLGDVPSRFQYPVFYWQKPGA